MHLTAAAAATVAAVATTNAIATTDATGITTATAAGVTAEPVAANPFSTAATVASAVPARSHGASEQLHDLMPG
jgi:hypothetical protein